MDLMGKGPMGQKSKTPAFGPQAELCRRTTCCCCHATAVIRAAPGEYWDHTTMRDYDWALLPALYDDGEGTQVIHPHHEPPRGLALKSTDTDTVPLCFRHHTGGYETSRHSDLHNRFPAKFWGFFGIEWVAVRDEMRRRVLAQ